MYMLVWLDFIIVLFTTLFVDLVYRYVVRFKPCFVFSSGSTEINENLRAETRTLIGGGGGGAYSYIHVLPDEFLFKSNSN